MERDRDGRHESEQGVRGAGGVHPASEAALASGSGRVRLASEGGAGEVCPTSEGAQRRAGGRHGLGPRMSG
jgi:hypothetical protein